MTVSIPEPVRDAMDPTARESSIFVMSSDEFPLSRSKDSRTVPVINTMSFKLHARISMMKAMIVKVK